MTTVARPSTEAGAGTSSPAALTALWFRTLVDGMTGTARIAGMLEAVQATQIAELVQTRRAEAVIEARNAVAEGRRSWSDAEAVERSIVDEVATALRVSTGVAGRRIADAESLVGRPATLRALAGGHIHARAAYAIAEGVGLLSGQAADAAEARVLAVAGRQTPAQVASAVRRAVIAADPAAADRAYRRAVQARSARCRPEEDGMASIWVSGSAERIARAWQTATAVAEHRRQLARAAGDQMTGGGTTGVPTLYQARADAMLDLLSSPEGLPDPCSHTQPEDHTRPDDTAPDDTAPDDTAPDDTAPDDDDARPHHAGPAHCAALPPVDVALHLVLPVDALGSEPAELDGHGPVPAAFVADLLGGQACRRRRSGPSADPTAATDMDASDAGDPVRFSPDAGRVQFTRWLVDDAGVVTTISQRVFTTYRPPPSLDATIRARDLTCRFPGCRTRARYCDIDHAIPHPVGATTAANLACLCRRHHRLKTHTRWRVAHRPGAVLEWTAPTGHTYLTYPPTWMIGQRQKSESDETPTCSTTPTATPPPPEEAINPPAWMFGPPRTPDPSRPVQAAPTRADSRARHEPALSWSTIAGQVGGHLDLSAPPGADTAHDVAPPF